MYTKKRSALPIDVARPRLIHRDASRNCNSYSADKRACMSGNYETFPGPRRSSARSAYQGLLTGWNELVKAFVALRLTCLWWSEVGMVFQAGGEACLRAVNSFNSAFSWVLNQPDCLCH
jgi:hypothetical protein